MTEQPGLFRDPRDVARDEARQRRTRALLGRARRRGFTVRAVGREQANRLRATRHDPDTTPEQEEHP